MGMSEFYGPGDERESIRTIHRALELGMNFLDTADIYGRGHNEEFVGRAIRGRREQVQRHFESCVYAMQNVRYDLLRLKSAGMGAVLGDLTQATQQARALSRDVDGAIAAVSEIRALVR